MQWTGTGGWIARVECPVDDTGTFRLPFLPAGEVELAAYATEGGWKELARRKLTLRAGADPEIELP